MPATSKAQRRFMAICEHKPSIAKGKCPDMTQKEFHDFAKTKEKGLVARKGKKHGKGMRA